MPRVGLLLVFAGLAGACSSDDDCEQLGSCQADGCHCAPGFAGPSCGGMALSAATLHSRPWPRGPLPPPTPAPSSHEPDPVDFNASTWGFSAIYDEHDGLWHAMVTSACGSKGVLASGGAGSFIAHLTSSLGPDRGFRLEAMVTPTTSFGPHLYRDPVSRDFVLMFRVNALEARPVCVGNASATVPDPMPASFTSTSYIRSEQLDADPTGKAGQNFYVAWAERMTGPWQVQKVNVTVDSAAAVLTRPDVHISNIALVFPKPGSAAAARGRVGMAFRYNPKGGEHNGYAVAESFRGPFVAIANLSTVEPAGSEDPYVFEMDVPAAESSGSRILHMIWHCRDFGYHAWSADGGLSWASRANQGQHFFNLSVSFEDGSTTKFKRRERPELMFDSKTGMPSRFVSSVQLAGQPDGTTYPIIQAFASGFEHVVV